ncbi:MAG: iron chaperone, partial [Alphaproteobacteria bacterium]
SKKVDKYLAGVPEPARSTLNRIRTEIRLALPPGATEVISYGMPAFKYKQIVLWFAAFANHCSLFPTALIVQAFQSELRGYETSKGTIRFPIYKPLPARLVRKLVHARLAQIESKKPH